MRGAPFGAAAIAGPRAGGDKDIKISLYPPFRGLLTLAETARDERLERRHDLGRLGACGRDRDRGAGGGVEHQQPHDRRAAHGFVAAGDGHVGVELLDREDELRRRARVQALAVDDGDYPHDRAFGRMLFRRRAFRVGRFGHLPASTRLATVMYLRPASCAWATASASGDSSRTLASLTSMGRLMPASTSTLGRFITEIERFEGVPPNMSVRMATPSPLSTRLTASMMSLRHRSESSSAPIVTASICFCGPMTCSSAALNSSARRPCVTSTRPIIENSSRVLLVHRTNAPL